MKPTPLSISSPDGYILLEVIIAMTIFSLSFVGLIRVLHQSQENATACAFEGQVRSGLEAILAEAKNRPLEEMAQEQTDPLLGIVYHTQCEPLGLSSQDGTSLKDLYKLRARATYTRSGRQEEDVAEIWIYHPEESKK
jgi:type II secretory pathway component PulJ